MITITVLIPVYNEEGTIIEILKRVNNQIIHEIEFEILVVNYGSNDNTEKLLKENDHLYTKLVSLPVNGGKGAAVIEGLRHASGEYVLFQDGDLEYDPHDYTKLVEPIMTHQADLVMGSRLIAPQLTRVHYFWHKVGNRLITLVFNIINNTTFTDIYSCYLIYRRSLIDPDTLRVKGWAQQAEILSKAVRKANVIYEAPISYHGRTYAEGKKITGFHVISIIYTMIVGRFTQ